MGSPAEEFGPYLVYEQIGLGGMASVHRAETQGIAGFRRPVALKRMLAHVAADENLVKSFVREARLASHLHHANVAQTLDLGKVGDIYYIAMELVPGRNLREILKHCATTAGAMPLPIALNILNQICDALDYAHNLCDESGQPLGIIHRDVSPSNIIVSEGGVVKLIDFGIAKASASGMQTMSGTIKGKFGYMAPEYLAGSIDARADLFALGVIAHELLSNKPLFQGKDDMDTLFRVKGMPIDPPSRRNPNVPPEIDSIVMTALERNPDARWQRANALRTALTTETKRLGLVAMNNQVVEWIEWAFQQTGRRATTGPQISIQEGTVPLIMPAGSTPGRAQGTPIHDPDDIDDDLKTMPPGGRRPDPGQRSDTIDDYDPDADAPTSLHRAAPPRSRSQPIARRSSQRPSASAPASTRPSQPPPAARPSQPPPAARPSQPQPIARPSQPQLPVAPVPSGARTAPQAAVAAPARPTSPADGAGTDERSVGGVLADLERSGITTSPMKLGAKEAVPAQSAAMTRIESRRSGGRGVLIALLMLLAAAGTAAVVYFVLPYFT